MNLDETWQLGLRPEKTKPCTFSAKSRYGFRREREKMGHRGVGFLWREQRTTSAAFLRSISAKLPTNTCPGGISRHMVSYSRKVSIKGSNFPKNPLFRVPCLCSAYGSREMFCDAYTLSIPWWTSHRCIFPRWLLLRDVPFSTYPPRKVTISAMAIPGWGHSSATWREAYHEHEETSLARWRHHRLRAYVPVGSPICSGIIIHCTFSSYILTLCEAVPLCFCKCRRWTSQDEAGSVSCHSSLLSGPRLLWL